MLLEPLHAQNFRDREQAARKQPPLQRLKPKPTALPQLLAKHDSGVGTKFFKLETKRCEGSHEGVAVAPGTSDVNAAVLLVLSEVCVPLTPEHLGVSCSM